MKWILFFLLIPFIPSAQTVHLKDEKIFYEGSIKTNRSPTDIQNALYEAEKNCSSKIHNASVDTNSGGIKLVSEMKLTPTQNTTNTLRYTLQLSSKEDQVHYRIDSVFVITKERGGKTKIISSEDIVKDMDVTGPVATATEKKLNEIDMRIQELIDRLTNTLGK